MSSIAKQYMLDFLPQTLLVILVPGVGSQDPWLLSQIWRQEAKRIRRPAISGLMCQYGYNYQIGDNSSAATMIVLPTFPIPHFLSERKVVLPFVGG